MFRELVRSAYWFCLVAFMHYGANGFKQLPLFSLTHNRCARVKFASIKCSWNTAHNNEFSVSAKEYYRLRFCTIAWSTHQPEFVFDVVVDWVQRVVDGRAHQSLGL